VFGQIAGLAVGRFPSSVDLPDDVLGQIIDRSLDGRQIPIMLGLEVGHVDPIATLPLGTRARLDASRLELTLLESPTRG
jgi:muramoyltetrapeptide carboxypeptidase